MIEFNLEAKREQEEYALHMEKLRAELALESELWKAEAFSKYFSTPLKKVPSMKITQGYNPTDWKIVDFSNVSIY